MYMYSSTSIPTDGKFHVLTSTEQSIIVRNSLIVLQEQTRYPVQSFVQARVSAAVLLSS